MVGKFFLVLIFYGVWCELIAILFELASKLQPIIACYPSFFPTMDLGWHLLRIYWFYWVIFFTRSDSVSK